VQYNQPYGVSDPNAAYINGNPSTGTMGSIPPAASIEYPQREIVNLINAAGLTPDNADLNQLARAIQSGKIIFGVDSGTANVYSIVLTPPLLSYYDGLAVWMLPANSNSGPSTININGIGVRNIVRRGGAPLQAGDMPAQYKSLLTYNALHSNFELYGTGFTIGGFMPILTANTTLYVNGATGDDNLYDGTTATVSGPHGPYKTINRAFTETFKYGPSVYYMTINVAGGTYNEAVQTPSIAGPGIILNGAGKGSTFITGANNANNTIGVAGANIIQCKNLFASNTHTNSGGGAQSCFGAGGGGYLTIDNCMVGSATNYMFSGYPGGSIGIFNIDFQANSTCQVVLSSASNSNVQCGVLGSVVTMNFLGPLACSYAFAGSSSNAIVAMGTPANLIMNNPSYVTGAKFFATMNGVILANGQGVNYFPGNSAGYTNTGGQYQ
jgi:hypothetical protein